MAKDKKAAKVQQEEEQTEVVEKKDKKKKDKKKKQDDDEEVTDAPAEINGADVIPPSYATPLASTELLASLLKLAQKARELEKNKKAKNVLTRGVKWTTKMIKKNVKGVCIIAGDSVPVDVWAHLPVYCQENKVPYVFIPSTNNFRSALMKPQVCIYLSPADDKEYKSTYDSVVKAVQQLAK